MYILMIKKVESLKLNNMIWFVEGAMIKKFLLRLKPMNMIKFQIQLLKLNNDWRLL